MAEPTVSFSSGHDESGVLYDRFLALLRGRNITASSLLASLPVFQGSPSIDDLSALKAWLDSFRPLPAVVVAELGHLYTVRLTYHSNAIEGNTLSQHETEMVLEHGITIGGKTLLEHLEVIGHRDALEYVRELAVHATPLTEREVKDIHSLILRPADDSTGRREAGAYRTLDVRAAGTGHVYPPHYRVQELMAEFVEWLNSEAAETLHPVEYAASAHSRLVQIHPFRDGNGRAARLLMNLCLLRAGYPIAVITNENRSVYINALVHAQSHGDDTGPLVQLVAAACRDSLAEYLSVCATAADSRGNGAPFYRAVLALAH